MSETGKPFSQKLRYAKVTSKSETAPTAYHIIGSHKHGVKSKAPGDSLGPQTIQQQQQQQAWR